MAFPWDSAALVMWAGFTFALVLTIVLNLLYGFVSMIGRAFWGDRS
jgi:hypothetical protein